MRTSRVKKNPFWNQIIQIGLYLTFWFGWNGHIFNILLQWNWVQVLCRCIALYLKLIKAEHYIFIYFLRRNTNSLWCIAWSEMFLTSHDVHISSNEVQDQVASRSASGPLGMTVSRRRWRVITGYEEKEFRRRYWTDSVWQRSINYPEGNDFWFK